MLRCKEFRTLRNLTQDDVAKHINKSRGAYANIENGKRDPDTETLIALAELFDVTVDNLLGLPDKHKEQIRTALSSSEEKLLLFFRSVNAEGQRHIIDSAESAASNSKYSKQDTSNMAI